MNSQQMIAYLTSYTGQKRNELDALDFAVALLKTGYSADQERIDTAIASAKAEVADQITALNTQIADLQAQITPNIP